MLGEMVSFELADPVRLGAKVQAVKIRPAVLQVEVGSMSDGVK